MPETNGTEQNEPEKISVYEYVEKYYKEEWSTGENNGVGGFRKKTYWEQFEELYQYNYSLQASNYPTEYELCEQWLAEKQTYMDERNRLLGEERESVYDNQKYRDAGMRYARNYLNTQISDSAALEAFRTMTGDVLLQDPETVQKETASAWKGAVAAKNEQTKGAVIQDLESEADKEAARKQKNEQLEQEETDEQLEEAEGVGEKLSYLVKGAPLRCIYGSHMRHLDMLESHGVYQDKKPVIHSHDMEKSNILPFGICSSPCSTLTERGSFLKGAPVDAEGNYLDEPDNQILTGLVCDPEIVDFWNNVNEDVMIADDATEKTKSKDECDCYPAVTIKSYLICKHGGIIYPEGSGQFEYAAYNPDYEEFPFEGDEERDRLYEAWLEDEDICRYYPTEEGFHTWYKDKIDNALKKNDKKKAKELYEEYLDHSFQVGLEQMAEPQRDTVRDMVKEYAKSGLLTQAKAEEMKERYSADRIDYGHNSQKNLLPYTPEQSGFYDYYLQQAEENLQQQMELGQQQVQSSQPGMQSNRQNGTSILKDLQILWKERDELYERFAREIELYQDVLTEEQKERILEIQRKFGKIG